MNAVQINPGYAVAPDLGAADFASAASAGFRTVLNFRPDGEAAGQLSSEEACRAASAVGLTYVHIPAQKFDLFTDGVVGATRAALNTVPGPILGTCGSGNRAAIAWAAASARARSVDDILAELDAAGLDLRFLRDDLDAQADRQNWRPAFRETTPKSEPARPLVAA